MGFEVIVVFIRANALTIFFGVVGIAVTVFFGIWGVKALRHPKQEPATPGQSDTTSEETTLEPSSALPKWLTARYEENSAAYVQRAEYAEVLDLLKNHNKVLLHGMGGIGKTELMRSLCKQLSEAYAHVAWITYTGSLRSSMIGQMTALKTKGFSEEEEAFENIKATLTNLGKDLILFVDNIDKTKAEDHNLNFLQQLEGTVVITARRSQFLNSFEDKHIDFLPPEGCAELFVKYAKPKKPYDTALIEKIVKLAGWHTLAIEIIARAAWQRRWQPPEVLQELKDKGFDIATAVATAHGDDKEEKMMEHLQKLYKISDIEKNPLYLYVLKNFAVLPYLPLPVEDAVAFLQLEEDQEQALYDLANLGWLERKEAGIAMHNIVQAVTKRTGITFENYETLIEQMSDIAAEGDFFRRKKIWPYLAHVATQVDEYRPEPEPAVAILYNNLAFIYREMGNFPAALKWQLKDKDITEALYPDGLHPELATSYDNLASIYKDMGDPSSLSNALDWQLKAKDIREKLFTEGVHPNLAQSYNNLAMIYKDMGELKDALTWQLKANAIWETLFMDEVHPNLATSYNNLAMIYQDMGDLKDALTWQLKANAIWETLFMDEVHPNLATSYHNLAGIYQDMGKDHLPAALTWQLKANNIWEALYPDGVHPALATSYNNLAEIYRAMGDLPAALEWQLKDITITEALFPDGLHPSLATSYNNLSLIYQDMGELKDALDWQLKAKAIREALYPEGVHPSLATGYNNLAMIYQAMGEDHLPAALTWQLKAKEIREKLFTNGLHPDLAQSDNNLAMIYQAMGDFTAALEWFEKALAICEKTLGPDHPNTKIVLNNIDKLKSLMSDA